MYYFETESDGWPFNRRVDRRLTLPAGDYRLRFRTNGSHSFDDWGRAPPEHRFWGIALYQDVSADQLRAACWETADRPEDLGWSRRKLERLIPELEQMNVAALMIVTDGQVVYEWGNTASQLSGPLDAQEPDQRPLWHRRRPRARSTSRKTLDELGIDDKTPLTEAEKAGHRPRPAQGPLGRLHSRRGRSGVHEGHRGRTRQPRPWHVLVL